MATPRKLKAKIELHPQYKVPRRIYEIEEKTTGAEPRQIAETFLKRIASDLNIKTDLSDLKFDQVKNSMLGNHALFQQYHNNKPISGAWVRIDIDKTGKVYNVHSDLVPERVLAKAETRAKAASRGAQPQLSQEQARARALEATGSSATNPHEIVEQEQVYYPVNGEPTAAWKVVVRSTRPAGEWKVYVDAASGEILRIIDLLKDQDGRGRIFDPNPVVTLNNTSLEDTSTIPEVAYQEVVLRDLDSSGHLDGKFVSTRPTSNRVKRSDKKFLFKRPDRGFKEVMVYFHIDRVQRYLQELGFSNVLNRAIEVSVDGIPDDNSFYSPLSKSLTFGTGGVDDAEDAEIILHEYGHAIQDAQVSGFGSGREARAMGEGFGDYLAASFFADRKPERLRPTVGNWDAVAYSGDDPPSLRRLDSNKKYPRDMVGEEHADGEIWSACLWQLRSALGGQTADRLVLAHHVLLTPESSFEDAAQALITADQQLHGGRNEETIREIFVRRGILPNRKRKNRRAGIPFAEIHSHNRRTQTRRRTARKGK